MCSIDSYLCLVLVFVFPFLHVCLQPICILIFVNCWFFLSVCLSFVSICFGLCTSTSSIANCFGQVSRPSAPSALASFLVEQWSWGLMSPQQVQRLMDKAKEDLEAHANGTLDFAEVERLASIGASGSSECNAFRDLKHQLADSKLAAATFSFMLPMKSPLCRFVMSNYPQELLLPHDMFSIMFHSYPDEFATKLLLVESSISVYR